MVQKADGRGSQPVFSADVKNPRRPMGRRGFQSVEKTGSKWQYAQMWKSCAARCAAWVPPLKNVPVGRFSPLLRTFLKNFVLCGGRQGLCPLTPPPFEKGRRKLFVWYFLGMDQGGVGTTCASCGEHTRFPAPRRAEAAFRRKKVGEVGGLSPLSYSA